MAYLAQSLRNAWDARDREYFERMLERVDTLEQAQRTEPPAASASGAITEHTEPTAGS